MSNNLMIPRRFDIELSVCFFYIALFFFTAAIFGLTSLLLLPIYGQTENATEDFTDVWKSNQTSLFSVSEASTKQFFNQTSHISSNISIPTLQDIEKFLTYLQRNPVVKNYNSGLSEVVESAEDFPPRLNHKNATLFMRYYGTMPISSGKESSSIASVTEKFSANLAFPLISFRPYFQSSFISKAGTGNFIKEVKNKIEDNYGKSDSCKFEEHRDITKYNVTKSSQESASFPVDVNIETFYEPNNPSIKLEITSHPTKPYDFTEISYRQVDVNLCTGEEGSKESVTYQRISFQCTFSRFSPSDSSVTMNEDDSNGHKVYCMLGLQ